MLMPMSKAPSKVMQQTRHACRHGSSGSKGSSTDNDNDNDNGIDEQSGAAPFPAESNLLEQCQQLAKGTYGLPEAIADIRQLKRKLAIVNSDRAGVHCHACLIYINCAACTMTFLIIDCDICCYVNVGGSCVKWYQDGFSLLHCSFSNKCALLFHSQQQHHLELMASGTPRTCYACSRVVRANEANDR